MSYAQQQIINLAPKLSDEAADAIVKLMNTFIVIEGKPDEPVVSEKRQAFERLEKIVSGFDPILDPEKEIAEAREAKYGTID